MTAPHTPGPWRWEINLKSKVLHLVGGQPRQYDLTIMDFDRWGMGRAVATLRDTAQDGMNIMHRLCDRPDWISPFPGRDHHADWCADVTHPDMRLMAAAPDLLAACVNARDMLSTDRQAFVDCQRLRDTRTEDPIAHGLVWVDAETWIAPEDAEPLRDYDRAIALIDAGIAKATGEAL